MHNRQFSEGTTVRLPFTTSTTEPPKAESVTRWAEATTDGPFDQMGNPVDNVSTSVLRQGLYFNNQMTDISKKLASFTKLQKFVKQASFFSTFVILCWYWSKDGRSDWQLGLEQQGKSSYIYS